MPIYDYQLKNGKTLTLEGDTQPTDADVEAAARSAGVELALAGEPSTPQGSTLMRTLSGMGKRALETPLNVLSGLKNLATSPLQTAKGLYESQLQQFDKAGEAAALGRYSEMFGHGAAGLLPVLGPVAADIGEGLGSGDAERAGAALTDAALLSLGSPTARSLAMAPIKAVASPANAALLSMARKIEGATKGLGDPGMVGRGARLFRELNPAKGSTRVPIERYGGNVPASRVTRGVEGVSPSVRQASQPLIERFSPNVPGTIEEGIESASGLLTREQQAAQAIDRFMPNRPSGVSDVSKRASFNRQTPQLVDEVAETVSAPGFDLGDIVNAPISIAAQKALRRRQMIQQTLDELRGSREHGTAGFRQLPELSDAEAARISTSIERIMGR